MEQREMERRNFVLQKQMEQQKHSKAKREIKLKKLEHTKLSAELSLKKQRDEFVDREEKAE